jgi:hypothetical protein
MSAIALKLKRVVLLVLPLLVVMTAAQAAPLVDPDPVLIPPGLSEQSVVKAIRVGSAKRGWMITKADPAHMEATLNVRVHTVKVNIDYDAEKIRIKYLSSEHLEYAEKNGQQHIHGNYNKWVRNLAVDISSELALLPPDAR